MYTKGGGGGAGLNYHNFSYNSLKQYWMWNRIGLVAYYAEKKLF